MGLKPYSGEVLPLEEEAQEASPSFVSPVTGKMGGGFGDSRSGGRRKHLAGDLSAPAGSPIVAPETIKFAQGGKGGTNLRDNDWWSHWEGVDTGVQYRFAHHDDISGYRPGDTVPGGEQWNVVGSAVDDPHLHMALHDTTAGKHIDWMTPLGLKRGMELTQGQSMFDGLERKAGKIAATVPTGGGLKPYTGEILPLEDSGLKPYEGEILPLNVEAPSLSSRIGQVARDIIQQPGSAEEAAAMGATGEGIANVLKTAPSLGVAPQLQPPTERQRNTAVPPGEEKRLLHEALRKRGIMDPEQASPEVIAQVVKESGLKLTPDRRVAEPAPGTEKSILEAIPPGMLFRRAYDGQMVPFEKLHPIEQRELIPPGAVLNDVLKGFARGVSSGLIQPPPGIMGESWGKGELRPVNEAAGKVGEQAGGLAQFGAALIPGAGIGGMAVEGFAPLMAKTLAGRVAQSGIAGGVAGAMTEGLGQAAQGKDFTTKNLQKIASAGANAAADLMLLHYGVELAIPWVQNKIALSQTVLGKAGQEIKDAYYRDLPDSIARLYAKGGLPAIPAEYASDEAISAWLKTMPGSERAKLIKSNQNVERVARDMHRASVKRPVSAPEPQPEPGMTGAQPTPEPPPPGPPQLPGPPGFTMRPGSPSPDFTMGPSGANVPAVQPKGTFQTFIVQTGGHQADPAVMAHDFLETQEPGWAFSPQGIHEASGIGGDVKHLHKELALVYGTLNPELAKQMRPDEIWRHLTPENMEAIAAIPRGKLLLDRLHAAVTDRMAEAQGELRAQEAEVQQKFAEDQAKAQQKDAEAAAKAQQKEFEAQVKEQEKAAQKAAEEAAKAALAPKVDTSRPAIAPLFTPKQLQTMTYDEVMALPPEQKKIYDQEKKDYLAKQEGTGEEKKKSALRKVKKAVEAIADDKLPWEMTQAEYVDGAIKSPAMHKQGVRLALSRGETVPEAVLADYPDLAGIYGKGEKATPKAPVTPATPPVVEAAPVVEVFYHGTGEGQAGLIKEKGFSIKGLEPRHPGERSAIFITTSPDVAESYAIQKGGAVWTDKRNWKGIPESERRKGEVFEIKLKDGAKIAPEYPGDNELSKYDGYVTEEHGAKGIVVTNPDVLKTKRSYPIDHFAATSKKQPPTPPENVQQAAAGEVAPESQAGRTREQMWKDMQENQFLDSLKLAADTPGQLRPSDVFRVVQEANDQGYGKEFVDWLRNQELSLRTKEVVDNPIMIGGRLIAEANPAPRPKAAEGADPQDLPTPELSAAIAAGWDMERQATQRTGPTIATALRRPVSGSKFKEKLNENTGSPGRQDALRLEDGERARRDFETFKAGIVQGASEGTQRIWRPVEHSEALRTSPVGRAILANAQAQGIAQVHFTRNAPFAGSITPTRDGYVMTVDEVVDGTHEQVAGHETFHYHRWTGNPAADKLYSLVNQKSRAFKRYAADLNTYYGNSQLTANEVADEIAADFASGLNEVTLRDGTKMPLVSMFKASVGAKLARTRYQKMVAGGLAERKAAGIGEPKYSGLDEEGAKTSTKNAVTEEERRVRGLDPVQKELFQIEPGAAEAKRLVDEGIQDPRELAAKIAKSIHSGKQTPITDVEGAMLMYDRMRLYNAESSLMDDLEQAISEGGDVAAVRQQLAQVADALDINDRAVTHAGTVTSASFRMRQYFITQDFSLARILQRARAAHPSGELPDALREKLTALTLELQAANKKLEAYEKGKAEQKVKKSVKDIENRIDRAIRKGEAQRKPKVEAMASFRSLAEKFRDTLGQLNMLLGPNQVAILAEMARELVIAGITDAKMVVNTIFDELDIPDLSRRDVEESLSGYGKISKPSQDEIDKALREVRRQVRLFLSLEDALSGQMPQRTGLQRDPVSDEVRALTREVKQAMRDAGIDSTSSRTPEEQWKTSLDAAKTRLNNQIRDNTKRLADLKAGRPVLKKKGGITYDQEANDLKAENDMLRAAIRDIEGKPGMSDEQKLKVLENAAQRSIENWERKIKERDFSPAKKVASPLTPPRLRIKQAYRDRLKKQYEQMKRDSRPETDPKVVKLRNAIKAVDKSIAEYERRLTEKDLSSRPKGTVTPETPELHGRRAYRDRLRKAYQQMQRDARPTIDPEVAANRRYHGYLLRRDAQLQEMLDTGNFEKSAKRVLNLDPETDRLKANVEAKKHKINEAIFKRKMEARTTFAKGLDWAFKWRRAVILSGVGTLGKLAAAATMRQISTPLEDFVGAAVRMAPYMKQVFDMAPTEGGGINVRAEAAGFVQWFKKQTWQESLGILKMKPTELELLYGKHRPHMPETFLDWFGHMHQALKNPIKRVIFYRTLQRRTEWAMNQGIDMTQPANIMAVSSAAYLEGNRAIFMNDNFASKAFFKLIRELKATGQPGLQSLATTLQVLMPIVKVPTNFTGEVASYTLGPLLAASRYYSRGGAKGVRLLAEHIREHPNQAFTPPKGFKGMNTDDADYIARNLKKGGLGLLPFLLGLAGAASVGGYWIRGEKRKMSDVKPGDIKLFGITISHLFLHHPAIFGPLMLGATIKRVMGLTEERKQAAMGKGSLEDMEKAEKMGSGIAEGIRTGAVGIAKGVPFFDTPIRMAQASENWQGMEKFAYQMAESLVIPPDLRRISKGTDKAGEELIPREKKTLGQVIKGSVPGMRKDVPLDANWLKRAPLDRLAEIVDNAPVGTISRENADILAKSLDNKLKRQQWTLPPAEMSKYERTLKKLDALAR